MAFSRRRGRPKKPQIAGKDKGTIELREKRKENLTLEPLDLCMQKGLITEQQHNAGIRLRWLYTLKFGAPSISSYLPDNVGGHSCKYEDNGWMERRQREYNIIIQELNKNKAREVVMNVCIFNRSPSFLYKNTHYIHNKNILIYKELNTLVEGLDIICKLIHNDRRLKIL